MTRPRRAWQRIPVPGVELETLVWGSGEPVVFIQTALVADELLPLAQEPALAQGYRKIVYHRRRYGRSSGADGIGSVSRDASDCVALLDVLQVDKAHIVGVSYSGAIGLQVAADAPDRAHTLTLIEPPPVHTPSAHEFRAANDRLLRLRRDRGAAAALDDFLTTVIGPTWRHDVEQQVPGAAAQMARDADTFFDDDLPALLQWQFDAADAGRISCAVMHIGGSHSGPWFAEVREIIRLWLPRADDTVIRGADHSLVLTHASEIACAVAGFLRRHPL